MFTNLKTRVGWITNPVRFYHMQVDGKKLLTIVHYGWRGVRQIRRYEVIDELSEDRTPMNREFPIPTKLP